SSTMEMKRSSGCRWWPSSHRRPCHRNTAPTASTARRIARARARESRLRGASARRDAEPLPGQEAADLFAVRLDPLEQPVDALGGLDARLPAQLAGDAIDVAVEDGLIAQARGGRRERDRLPQALLEDRDQLAQREAAAGPAADVVGLAVDGGA